VRQLYLQKVNIHLFISLVTIHKVTLCVTCHFYKWSRWNPPIKNKMGTRTLFSRRGSHPRLQAIKLLASLTQSTQNFVSPNPTSTRPNPHRCPTWHQFPQGRQAWVAPAPEAPTTPAQGWRSSLPLLKLSALHLHVVLKVDNPVGTGLHLLTSDVEQHTGVVASMLSITKATVNLL
jgi:hypothetical protein